MCTAQKNRTRRCDFYDLTKSIIAQKFRSAKILLLDNPFHLVKNIGCLFAIQAYSFR